MDSDDISNSLGNRQIFELIGKEHQSAEIYGSIFFVDLAALIGYFERKHVLFRFKALVWKLSIQNDSIKVQFRTSNGAFF
jgi:hypothetical protein